MLLGQALELAPDQRLPWLERQTARDSSVLNQARALLAADAQAEEFLEIPALGSWLDEGPILPGDLVPGARIGPYRIERLLGRGGMGRVLLAVREDDDFRQLVAIKVADRAGSPNALRRFRLERQILSDLDHRNIAKLYDGGSTDLGQPYLVMEHIEGQPIHTYCDGLPVAQRLALLRKVLAAVAYAHRHLVVHLDLKPANILVDGDGEPKLLDFGIAKLLGTSAGATLTTEERPLTPDFASPEQLRGERLTTSSDIYSLGLLLHRLLTGTLPNRAPGGRKVESAGPKRLASDLEAILGKALEPDPGERYPTVEGLDGDLERHLTGRPIFARPPTWSYRAGRFAHRHWPTLTLVAMLFLATLGAAATVSLQARRISAERDRTELARAEAEDVAAFLTDLLGRFEPGELPGTAFSVQDVLDRGTAALGKLDDHPKVRARLLGILGSTYRAWGRPEAAAPLLEEALEIRRRELGGVPPELAKAINDLGRLARARSDFGKAAELHREALDVLRRHYGKDHLAVGDTFVWLADALYDMAEMRAALANYHRGLDIRRRYLGKDHQATAVCLGNIAKVSADLGLADDALRYAHEAVEITEKLWPEGHPATAASLNVLGQSLLENRRLKEAETVIQRVVELRRRFFGRQHPRSIEAVNNLGLVYQQQGHLVEAEKLFRESRALLVANFGADHQNTAKATHNLGVVLVAQNRLREAEPLMREVLDIMRRSQPDSDNVFYPLGALAQLLLTDDRPEEALPYAEEAVRRARRALGTDHAMTRRFGEIVKSCRRQLAGTVTTGGNE